MTEPCCGDCCPPGGCQPCIEEDEMSAATVAYNSDDTVPIQLVVCGHTDSPWCPRCAGGLQ